MERIVKNFVLRAFICCLISCLCVSMCLFSVLVYVLYVCVSVDAMSLGKYVVYCA